MRAEITNLKSLIEGAFNIKLIAESEEENKEIEGFLSGRIGTPHVAFAGYMACSGDNYACGITLGVDLTKEVMNAWVVEEAASTKVLNNEN